MAKKHLKKISKTYYSLLGLSSLAYVALTFLSPVSAKTTERFGISELQVQLLQLTLVIPILIIWFLIVFGGVKFKTYAALIKGTDEGDGLSIVSNGLLFIAFGGIFLSLAGIALRLITGGNNIEQVTIFRNYAGVVVQLASYLILFTGSLRLLKVTAYKSTTYAIRAFVPTLFLVAAVATYTVLMFQNPNRNTSPDPGTVGSFYLSDLMIFFTLVLPYALSWTLATFAIINLRAFAHEVKGIVYKQAIRRLVLGLTLVVSFAIALGMLSAFSEVFVGASLKFVLTFIYVILIGYSAGFLVIASGARKLTRIEEV